jgi:hypothetical protein
VVDARLRSRTCIGASDISLEPQVDLPPALRRDRCATRPPDGPRARRSWREGSGERPPRHQWTATCATLGRNDDDVADPRDRGLVGDDPREGDLSSGTVDAQAPRAFDRPGPGSAPWPSSPSLSQWWMSSTSRSEGSSLSSKPLRSCEINGHLHYRACGPVMFACRAVLPRRRISPMVHSTWNPARRRR